MLQKLACPFAIRAQTCREVTVLALALSLPTALAVTLPNVTLTVAPQAATFLQPKHCVCKHKKVISAHVAAIIVQRSATICLLARRVLSPIVWVLFPMPPAVCVLRVHIALLLPLNRSFAIQEHPTHTNDRECAPLALSVITVMLEPTPVLSVPPVITMGRQASRSVLHVQPAIRASRLVPLRQRHALLASIKINWA